MIKHLGIEFKKNYEFFGFPAQINSEDLEIPDGQENAWSDTIARVLGASQQFMRKQKARVKDWTLHLPFSDVQKLQLDTVILMDKNNE